MPPLLHLLQLLMLLSRLWQVTCSQMLRGIALAWLIRMWHIRQLPLAQLSARNSLLVAAAGAGAFNCSIEVKLEGTKMMEQLQGSGLSRVQ
jgi:hypothetical protein